MLKLDRKEFLALVALALVSTTCLIVPIWSLKMRADATQNLADDEAMLQRLEHAPRHLKNVRGLAGPAAAPRAAFLDAQTVGLASAQLESYISQLSAAHGASLVSSGVLSNDRADMTQEIRVQATLDIAYDDLQRLLFQIETGTPYVFIDAMTLQTTGAALSANDSMPMRATLILRALRRR